jgi:hypothetical protein
MNHVNNNFKLIKSNINDLKSVGSFKILFSSWLRKIKLDTKKMMVTKKILCLYYKNKIN